MLDGFRGTPPSDIAAIVDTLLRLSAMVCNHPEISELDINPLIVHAKGEGCSVADSRIMLKRPTAVAIERRSACNRRFAPASTRGELAETPLAEWRRRRTYYSFSWMM